MPDPAVIQLRSNKQPTYISEFGWEGLVAGRGVGLLSILWDGLCFGLGRGFEMRAELWDEGFT